MKASPFIVIVFITNSLFAQQKWNYPVTPEILVVDDYNGVKITDNYRWLEDMKNPEVQQWFKKQAVFTDSVISKIPGTTRLFKEMNDLANMQDAQYFQFSLNGSNTYYLKSNKGEDVVKLYESKRGSKNEKLIFDPLKYKTGKNYVIYDFKVSNQGKYISVGLSKGGAEIGESIIIETATARILPEVLSPTWGSVNNFTKDENSVLYYKFQSADNTDENMLKDIRLMLHRIGSDVKEDIEIASRTKYPELPIKPESWPHLEFSADYRYIFLNISSVQKTRHTYFAPATEFGRPHINWKPFLSHSNGVVAFSVMGDKVFFLSHKNAPNYRIGMTDMRNPDFENAKIIVPESTQYIKKLSQSKDLLFYTLSDGINQEIYQLDPKSFQSKKIPLKQGNNFWEAIDKKNNSLICTNIGWTIPPSIYIYDGNSGKLEKSNHFNTSTPISGLENLITKEIEIKSYDGTMVPLSIVYPKNMKFDGNTICLLEGYGGYGISSIPYFFEPYVSMMKKNVVFASAHVRGGGEKGKSWHDAGKKQNKFNTWKDFIACAEYLINNKYTSSQKLIISGGSAGGIMIGNAIAEKPDLFGVALISVGCTNTLRSEFTPNGPNQIPEFGSLSNAEELKGLIAMDARHKITKGINYPAVLVNTGFNDTRVSPWEPAKFAAILQNNAKPGKPNLLLVNYDSGHFSGDRSVEFRIYSALFSYALWQTGHPDFQPK